jgi:glycosyltransferase involved in cell wall biosynthesis
MSQPPISVVMPVYNIKRFLPQAVESILGQTFGDFEFLVVEGGSTDGSREIVQGYGDKRIRIVEHPVGASIYKWFVGALNHGVAQAQAPLIARMDGDDVSLPRRFERQVQVLGERPDILVLGCGMDFITERGATSTRSLNGELVLSHREGNRMVIPHIPHGSVTFRKEAFIKAGGYRDQLIHEDTDMWLRLAESGLVGLLQERLFLYRINKMSLVSTMQWKPGYHGALIQAFSIERLARGSDPLQRGEPLPPTPNATWRDARWLACTRNSEVATIEKRHVAAVLWSLGAMAVRPLSSARRVAHAVLGVP